MHGLLLHVFVTASCACTACSGDGVVLMSNVALVVDGHLLTHASNTPGHAAGMAAPGSPTSAGGLSALMSSASSACIVPVSQERLVGLRDRLLEVAALVGAARSEAEYKVGADGHVSGWE